MHPETERDEQERGIAGTRTAVPRFSFTDRRHKAAKEQTPRLRNTNGMFTTHKRPTCEAQTAHLRKANAPPAKSTCATHETQTPHLRNTNDIFTTHKQPTYEAQVTHLRKANGPSATHKHPIHDSKPHIYLFIWLPTKNKQAYFALFPICIIFAQQALQNPATSYRSKDGTAVEH